jgi:type VI secretion system protein ImpK
MNDRLANRVYPTILYVLDLLDRINGRKPGGVPDPNVERPKLKQYVGQLDSGKSTREDELAKAALVYWIDEVLINAPWPHQKFWENHTLEFEYFNTLDAAYLFYEQAKTAKSLSPADALETFYICVALGFLGVYRGRDVVRKQPLRAAAPKPLPAPPPPRSMGDSWPVTSPGLDDSWDKVPLPPKPQEIPQEALSEDSMFAPPAGGPQHGMMDLPDTLEGWAAPVYAQIAPGRQRPFQPNTAPDSQRDARPLSGWAACQRAMVGFLWTVLLTIAVGAFAVYKGLGG